jgi:hypothetical protein
VRCMKQLTAADHRRPVVEDVPALDLVAEVAP